MKKALSSMDLYYLLKELDILISGKIDQIYQKGKEELTLQMHVTGKGKKMLRIILPSMMYLTIYKGEQPPEPPGFCKFLRKRLKSARLQKIEQKGFERIVDFTFSTKETTYHLIVELFSDGNVILCDENYKIISPLTTGNWKDRTIRGGIEYTYPKRDINFLDISEDDFKKNILASDKESIVKTLAMDFGLGGSYAEELCTIAEIDKDKKADEKDISKLYSASREFISREIEGNVTEKDILPFKFKTKEAKTVFTSFNEALDETLTEEKITSQNEIIASKKEKEMDKINAMIKQQEQTIKDMERKIEESQKKAELIYENYDEIKEALQNPEKSPLVKDINKKDKTITIEIK